MGSGEKYQSVELPVSQILGSPELFFAVASVSSLASTRGKVSLLQATPNYPA
jgi:hypothetical protein